MTATLEQELLDLAGGWPLLLGLINRRLAADLRTPGGDIEVAAAYAARRLRQEGRQALDVTDDGNRESAAAATIGYSLGILGTSDQLRFSELGIFAEDADVPLPVAGLLWQGTAGLSSAQTSELCDRLDSLALVSATMDGHVRMLVIHDVIRDYARHHLGEDQGAAQAALIHAARSLTHPDSVMGSRSIPDNEPADGTSWWRLPGKRRVRPPVAVPDVSLASGRNDGRT
jgi:hypothetical protein